MGFSEFICNHPSYWTILILSGGAVIGGTLMLVLVYFLTKWKQEDEVLWKEPDDFSYPKKPKEL